MPRTVCGLPQTAISADISTVDGFAQLVAIRQRTFWSVRSIGQSQPEGKKPVPTLHPALTLAKDIEIAVVRQNFAEDAIGVVPPVLAIGDRPHRSLIPAVPEALAASAQLKMPGSAMSRICPPITHE